jgi:hypothetical protein
MAKKGGDKKKGEGDLEKEMKQQLTLDVDVLENKIFQEQAKEQEAMKELERINKEIVEEMKIMEQNRLEEGRKINNESDLIKQTLTKYSGDLNELERKINEYNLEIKFLENKIVETGIEYKKQLEEKDSAINEQRKLFEDMSVRFQHILQRTANKLQERVNMGA